MKKLINPKTNAYLECKRNILCDDFPWYFQPYFTVREEDNGIVNKNVKEENYSNPSFYGHQFLGRPIPSRKYSITNSSYIGYVTEVLDEIFEYNKIEVNCIYRINANMVFPVKGKQSTVPHTDHPFPHKNLIIYLTDAGGETVCGLRKHKPKEDDIITFKGQHYNNAPLTSRRVILLCTYI